ncbi:MAG: hemerythrin domain-containing protein [Ignavibacteriales bacterium]
MATTQTSKSKSSSKSRSSSRSKSASTGQQDAIQLLKADHREVEQMFSKFENTNGAATKSKLADQICLALKVHTQIEEEIFYPAAREALTDEEMIDEAVVEHAAAKDLIAEIEAMDVDEDLFDAKVKVLSEQIEHHVEEEEKELFPKLQKTDMDMRMLGMRMAERKKELMSSMARPNGQRVQ